MKLFVTGAPRSGTRWLSTALRQAGVRVGHEGIMRDGMVSSLAAVDDFLYVNTLVPKTSTLRFERIWVQTRHPLDCIPSVATALRKNFWHWQQVHTGVPGDLEPPLLKAMIYWNAWMPKALSWGHEWRYPLESTRALWPEILDRLSAPQVPYWEKPAGQYTSGAARTSWDELESLDRTAAAETRKLAYEMGYV